ncbi:helix-turn-helix domain-containing protein [Alkalihalobacillus sp. R86527]|uniref:helix-turn-helix domain-containing protein n=1 Tax=Alkalihalobacillus sp. R86527 TaxID=3093863 RepID=UPI003672F2A9
MIGAKIKLYRNRMGLSLTELAKRAGVAKSYLSSIERNQQANPSIQFLEKIATVLKVPMDVFIHEDEFGDRESQLDPEWEALIEEAMRSGITKEDFEEFLEFRKWQLNKKE